MCKFPTPSNDLSLINILQLLSVDRVMNHLDIIRLRLRFREFNIPENFMEPRLERGWDKLDVDVHWTLFPSLSQVSMDIDFSEGRSDFDRKIFSEFVTQQLKERFAFLSTSDRISFSLIVVLQTGVYL